MFKASKFKMVLRSKKDVKTTIVLNLCIQLFFCFFQDSMDSIYKNNNNVAKLENLNGIKSIINRQLELMCSNVFLYMFLYMYYIHTCVFHFSYKKTPCFTS
jgi:hypothetical protein